MYGIYDSIIYSRIINEFEVREKEVGMDYVRK